MKRMPIIIILFLFLLMVPNSVDAYGRGVNCSASGTFDYIKFEYSYSSYNNDYVNTWYLHDYESNSIGEVYNDPDDVEISICVVIETVPTNGFVLIEFGKSTTVNISNVDITLEYNSFQSVNGNEPIDITIPLAVGAVGAIIIVLTVIVLIKKQ